MLHSVSSNFESVTWLDNLDGRRLVQQVKSGVLARNGL
jgi:hypothetical protein